ncbi:hypothetical protein HYU92_05565 [Candidatus Curtissbacteria bacterium]|nr:hypothetical protein [Candidatus Curtissbacteria bacterium]
MSTFQSYLIIGRGDKKRGETASIAKELGININKISPDIFIISPVKKSVSIDQIRELKQHIFQKPVKDKYKFILIEQAEKLTKEAQNALLKIYEEPPTHAIIVLEANDKSQILPTIQSRAIIKQIYDDKFQTDDIKLLEENKIESLLEKISRVENPTDWLDNQVIHLYNQLKQIIRDNPQSRRKNHHTYSTEKISETIQKCIMAKEMINANVNPKFALANLIFSIHL